MFTGTPTAFLKLPQYNADDHPDFLTDFNKAFQIIDENAVKTNQLITQMQTKIAKLENDLAQTRLDSGLRPSVESEENNG